MRSPEEIAREIVYRWQNGRKPDGFLIDDIAAALRIASQSGWRPSKEAPTDDAKVLALAVVRRFDDPAIALPLIDAITTALTAFADAKVKEAIAVERVDATQFFREWARSLAAQGYPKEAETVDRIALSFEAREQDPIRSRDKRTA